MSRSFMKLKEGQGKSGKLESISLIIVMSKNEDNALKNKTKIGRRLPAAKDVPINYVPFFKRVYKKLYKK